MMMQTFLSWVRPAPFVSHSFEEETFENERNEAKPAATQEREFREERDESFYWGWCMHSHW
ncbi:hypothetical protein [Aquamicrobium sp. LC103]|uniref:hypothetical protein n=1 Tax=Aquamicrobium sp. LC103 TaxID=1120658 RepID=UPI00109CD440|nr:hypothetical protein [Aquamicrobium sp. LC103]TKT75244.1 hypothetical protein XW59_019090 [Aquamicrobium sp. LC103]